jgi:hypothetical protein
MRESVGLPAGVCRERSNAGLPAGAASEASVSVGGSNSVVESQPSKLLVAGSIPVSRSILRQALAALAASDGRPEDQALAALAASDGRPEGQALAALAASDGRPEGQALAALAAPDGRPEGKRGGGSCEP